jgi:hypothetical protein
MKLISKLNDENAFKRKYAAFLVDLRAMDLRMKENEGSVLRNEH